VSSIAYQGEDLVALGSRTFKHIAAAAIVTAASLMAMEPAAAAPAESAVAPVVWGECAAADISNVPPAERFRFSCANYVVPLDYDRPNRGTINLALMRRAAGNQANRIGSLFLNPGGPGGSGYRFPTITQLLVQPAVADRFDVIGFDPRGVARSTPLRCFATQEDADAVFGRMALLPITRQEERSTLDALRDYGRFCDRFAGPLLNEMSTQNVAKDLDRLRAAVGDRQLNFLGFSYGTLLGATYVNLFPNRSRAIILDGNVDPNLRLHNGLEYDRQRTGGFEIALNAFLKECDAAGPACAFSDGSPRAKFDELRTYLRETGPITLPDGSTVAIDEFTDAVAGTLYDLTALDDLAAALQGLYDVINPPAAAQRRAPSAGAEAMQAVLGNAKQGRYDIRPDTPYASDDSYAGVNCTDKPFRHRAGEVPSIADKWERQFATFGRYLAWADPAICPNWPLDRRDVYSGPWNRKTPNPVLVYGNYYDPATQYEFSRRMARQLGNARLVSADAFGHTILGFSTCTDDIATSYLIELKVPRPGVVCQPNIAPFPTSA
jgi:pimeloyl-ACP methyl ester carboxylesterase